MKLADVPIFPEDDTYIDAFRNIWITYAQLICSEGTSFVRAEHINALGDVNRCTQISWILKATYG